MKRISIDNGATFDTVNTEDDVREIFWSILNERNISYGSMWLEIVNMMDDEIRERVHEEIDPDHTEAEFLIEYLKQANDDLIIV